MEVEEVGTGGKGGLIIDALLLSVVATLMDDVFKDGETGKGIDGGGTGGVVE